MKLELDPENRRPLTQAERLHVVKLAKSFKIPSLAKVVAWATTKWDDRVPTFPLTPKEALKYRCCGRKMLKYLVGLGLVAEDPVGPGTLSVLTSRTRNCLLDVGCKTPEQFIRLLQLGQIFPGERPVNYGNKSHIEACRWAGVDPGLMFYATPKFRERLQKKLNYAHTLIGEVLLEMSKGQKP